MLRNFKFQVLQMHRLPRHLYASVHTIVFYVSFSLSNSTLDGRGVQWLRFQRLDHFESPSLVSCLMILFSLSHVIVDFNPLTYLSIP